MGLYEAKANVRNLQRGEVVEIDADEWERGRWQKILDRGAIVPWREPVQFVGPVKPPQETFVPGETFVSETTDDDPDDDPDGDDDDGEDEDDGEDG